MLRHFLLAVALAASLAGVACGIKGPLVPPPVAATAAVPPTTVSPSAPTGPTARPAERAQ